MRATRLVLCLVGLSFLFPAAEARQWTTANGTRFEAEFLLATNGSVALTKPDGARVVFPMHWLSKEDQQYVQATVSSGVAAKPKGGKEALVQTRTWTRSDRTMIEAGFVRLEQRTGKRSSQVIILVLKKVDGAEISMRLTTLCENDQKYVIQRFSPSPPPPDVQPAPPMRQPQRAPVVKPVPSYKVERDTITPIRVGDWIKTLDRIKEAKNRFRDVLEDFPANSVTAQVVGLPKLLDVDGDKVTIGVEVRLAADEMHMRRFLNEALFALEDFEEYHWEESWLFGPTDKFGSKFTRIGMQGKSKSVTEDMTVYVNTEKNESWTCLRWKAFGLNQMLAGIFSDAAKRRCECVVSVVTKAGDTIPVDCFPLDDEQFRDTALITERSSYGNGGRTFFISPTFLHEAGCSQHTPTVTVSRRIKIRESLLDHLEGFKCMVRLVSGSKDEVRRHSPTSFIACW
jgi:hypothetical protein